MDCFPNLGCEEFHDVGPGAFDIDCPEGEEDSAVANANPCGHNQAPRRIAFLHTQWAFFLQKANHHERALEHFYKAIQIRPSGNAYFGLGTSLAALRRRTEAQQALEKAIKIAPYMSAGYVNLASVQMSMGDFKDAVDSCNKALQIEPAMREAVMNLSNARRMMGQRSLAIQTLWEHVMLVHSEDENDADLAKMPVDPPVFCCRLEPYYDTLDLPIAVVCVKWGKRYDADYVNRLKAGVLRGMPVPPDRFVCYTDDARGLDTDIEVRGLPDNLKGWWGKVFLFSEEAGLDGYRVIYFDLDQVIVGDLTPIVAYDGPFAILKTDGIACELAKGGYNSSVMSWEASPSFRPIWERCCRATLLFVHRFDHWLEMTNIVEDFWQDILPGAIVDYTTTFRNGICLGANKKVEPKALEPGCQQDIVGDFPQESAFALVKDVNEEEAMKNSPSVPPPNACIVTFPRTPKPHEVLSKHHWIRHYWLLPEEQPTPEFTEAEVQEAL
mmetsp:Transcript_53773/g.114791  ORF Transcript_53773/g.114791 Transcript_53773/m.114791 type:complete len:497 (+) Transcript_53773:190-1680(+)